MAIKKNSDPYLVYAINAEGALVHFDNVPNGLACNCVCPYCKDKLIAKNGGEINAAELIVLVQQSLSCTF